MMRLKALSIYLPVLILMTVNFALANILHVRVEYNSIQEAIDAAEEGDTVLVEPGRYRECINYNGKSIKVASYFINNNQRGLIEETIIDAANRPICVDISSIDDTSAALIGFTVTNASEIGIECWSSVATLKNLIVRDNNGGNLFIGAIFLSRAESVLSDITLENNNSVCGSALVIISSDIYLRNVTIRRNSCDESGGGIYVSHSNLVLDNADIDGNYAVAGGGISSFQSLITLKQTVIRNNVATHSGGGLCLSLDSEIDFYNDGLSSIYQNKAPYGSDIYSSNPEDTIDVLLDTFTVLCPTPSHVIPIENFTFDILNGKYTQVNYDLFVSPEGSDQNDGLSAESPLHRINTALNMITADSLHPCSIYLAPGVYCSTSTDEYFPLKIGDYISLIGEYSNRPVLNPGNSLYGIMIEGRKGCKIKNVNILDGSNSHSTIIECENSDLSITRSCIANNLGTGIHCDGSSILMKNVTIFGNNAGTYGGITSSRSNLNIINSIIWHNSPEQIIAHSNESVLVTNSNLQDGRNGIIEPGGDPNITWLESNISTDPDFLNISEGNFHLSSNSPCIDAGSPFIVWRGDTLVNMTEEEYSGEAPDMGVYEFEVNAAGSDKREIPVEFNLLSAYPNPFNSTTTVGYSVPSPMRITMSVHDLQGRKVFTCFDVFRQAGEYRQAVSMDGMASGVYVVRINDQESVNSERITLEK